MQIMSRTHRRVTLDYTYARIEAFNEAKGGGVSVRKDARGYSLVREDSGRPVARLRPNDRGDRYDVLCWSHREKWEPIGDSGGVSLPLDEALEFIADDPYGCFW